MPETRRDERLRKLWARRMTRSLHVVLCNERLVFRFGVDRILLMLGRGLAAQGHRVTLVCARCDPQVRELFGPSLRVVEMPEGIGLHAAEAAAETALANILDEFSAAEKPDIVVSGGWPFFSAARLGLRRALPSVFIDAGAIAQDGLSQHALAPQLEVRRLRAASLPHFTSVLPISRFIRDSQTIPDRGGDHGVKTILLGVDHLEDAIFKSSRGEDARESALLDKLRAMAGKGVPLILNLGRYESSGYKNSPSVFEVLRALRAARAESVLLILGDDASVAVPADCAGSVQLLGFVSDAALAEVMAISDVGVSVSIWEGFNLPVGEMQFAGKPVLALNAGAHPEVILDPWCLASSPGEIGRKAALILAGAAPAGMLNPAAFARYRARFLWKNATSAYIAALAEIAGESQGGAPASARLVFVDVSNSSRDPANSGVTRVTRKLLAHMQGNPLVNLVFVWWDGETRQYRVVEARHRACLEAYGGPRELAAYIQNRSEERLSPAALGLSLAGSGAAPPLLFLPEIAMDGQAPTRLAWARKAGFETAVILYDLIPVYHPEYCAADIVAMFPPYLEGVAAADRVICISSVTQRNFEKWAGERGLPIDAKLTTRWLPGQFASEPRRLPDGAPGATGQVSIVCVSTIEPRKNHKTLIAAMLDFLARRPDIDARLTLIGNRYGGSPELAEFVEAACRENPRIVWLGAVSDERVAREISAAAFLVYPSLVEGFGLPILESLWMGKPCLCHNSGVMAELAAPGGCLTVDMRAADQVSSALERLSADGELAGKLAREAGGRPLLRWQEYSHGIVADLTGGKEERAAPAPLAASTTAPEQPRGLAEAWALGIALETERLRVVFGDLLIAPQPAVFSSNRLTARWRALRGWAGGLLRLSR